MISHTQPRLIYLACTLVVIALGLASRRYAAALPAWVGAYVGDGLWAMMVYFGTGVMVPRARLAWRGAAALAFAFAIEASQLYQAQWINEVRRTRLGGLVLGQGFVWSDLVCYAAGVSAGLGVEALVRRFIPARRPTARRSQEPGCR
ncbi:MAG: DUF2809 domain-containing protein [Phycisphaeraceae bacterium]|nr:DUF2809 domain-containing protein [Phycisphaeraceae bacterium]